MSHCFGAVVISMTPIRAYFIVFGCLSFCIGIVLFTNLRGLGKRWENEINKSNARVARAFGWLPNRYVGRTWRPFAASVFTVLGIVVLGLATTGAIH